MTTLPTAQQSAEIDQFLEQLKNATPTASTGTGRLILTLDATASREATWDHACRIQGEMFEATAAIGGLAIQLMFYRGFSECKASRWLSTAADLHHAMRSVSCAGGRTQIGRVFDHTIRETSKQKVNALVFVGDALEEPLDPLCHLAGELGRLGVPLFTVHDTTAPPVYVAESHRNVAGAFRRLAQLSGGAYLPFDLAGVAALKTFLGALALFAAGGRQALEAYGREKGGEVLRLTTQLRGMS